MIDTPTFYNELINHDFDFFCGVPDSLLKNFCAYLFDHHDPGKHIITANEGNAIALAAGYHLAGGKYGVVYLQNSGLGNTVNPLLSLTDPAVYSLPLLMIIGWRGEPGTKDEPQHLTQGKLTLPLLETLGIEYLIVDENFAAQIKQAHDYLANNSRPFALVVRKGTFSDYSLPKKTSPYSLTREESLEIIIAELSATDFVVSTTGKTSREIYEIRERNGQDHGHDFLTVGSMGHTASIAAGLSLAVPNDIYVIDGDGSFLMHMGSLPVLAGKVGKNFKYILNNNGCHETVGGQPTVALTIDVPGILKASGFTEVYTAQTPPEIREALNKMKDEKLSALVLYTKPGSRADLGRPLSTPQENKKELMNKLAETGKFKL